MSISGKNIKKIRSVKKLSQTQFAELFGLSRASIGSYEEGRAEPKIDKIIEIANYFSIKIDSFLKKELSVNEISGFELRDDKMLLSGGDNLIHSSNNKNVTKRVPLVESDTVEGFSSELLGKVAWTGETIELPPRIDNLTSMAFIHNDNAMSVSGDGIFSSDIVFGQRISENEIFDNYIYLVVQKDNILLRKVIKEAEGKLKLIALNNNFQPVLLDGKDVVAFYKLTAIVKKTINHFID